MGAARTPALLLGGRRLREVLIWWNFVARNSRRSRTSADRLGGASRFDDGTAYWDLAHTIVAPSLVQFAYPNPVS